MFKKQTEGGRGGYQYCKTLRDAGIDLAVVFQRPRARVCVQCVSAGTCVSVCMCVQCVYAVSCAAFVLKHLRQRARVCLYACVCMCVRACSVCVRSLYVCVRTCYVCLC